MEGLDARPVRASEDRNKTELTFLRFPDRMKRADEEGRMQAQPPSSFL